MINQSLILPKISITIPTYNEAENIQTCLESISVQDYPKGNIEVIVVDGGSTDKTVEIAQQFPFVTVLSNPGKDTHIGKAIGLKASKGDFWIFFDADLQANGPEWAKSMVLPLVEDASLTASVSCYYGRPGDSCLEKYINLDPTARDTLFAWFTPSVESTIEKWKDGYAICCYTTEYLPAEGRCLFRYSLLMEMIGCEKRFRELDCLYLLTQAGHNRYAYVPNPGFYHKQIRTLAELRRKRMRNAIKNYIPGQVEGYIKYTWFDLYKPLDFLKMCALIFYAFSVIGPVLGGIWKSLKYQTHCGMVEAVYVPVAVEAYLEAFVRTKQGRLFVLRTFKGLFFRHKT